MDNVGVHYCTKAALIYRRTKSLRAVRFIATADLASLGCSVGSMATTKLSRTQSCLQGN